MPAFFFLFYYSLFWDSCKSDRNAPRKGCRVAPVVSSSVLPVKFHYIVGQAIDERKRGTIFIIFVCCLRVAREVVRLECQECVNYCVNEARTLSVKARCPKAEWVRNTFPLARSLFPRFCFCLPIPSLPRKVLSLTLGLLKRSPRMGGATIAKPCQAQCVL